MTSLTFKNCYRIIVNESMLFGVFCGIMGILVSDE